MQPDTELYAALSKLDRRKLMVKMYQEAHLSCEEIGKRFGLTRQAVHQQLRRAGVDTSKKSTAIGLICPQCGTPFTASRSRLRRVYKSDVSVYCSRACRWAARREKKRGGWSQ